jgi:hypothetical protein
MGLMETELIVGFTCSAVLVAIFAITLVRVCRGSRFSFVIKLCIMLMLSNLGAIGINYAQTLNPSSMTMIWILGLSFGVTSVFFNVSHFLLADKYKEIATEIPKIIEQQPPEKKRTCTYWTLLTLNIAAPVIQVASIIYANTLVYVKNGSLTKLADVVNIIAFDLVGLLQIISGVMLINGVIRIRRFFSGKPDAALNTKYLTLHAGAFGLYLVAVFVLYFVNNLVLIYPTSS